jgi:hypothetical protein
MLEWVYVKSEPNWQKPLTLYQLAELKPSFFDIIYTFIRLSVDFTHFLKHKSCFNNYEGIIEYIENKYS